MIPAKPVHPFIFSIKAPHYLGKKSIIYIEESGEISDIDCYCYNVWLQAFFGVEKGQEEI